MVRLELTEAEAETLQQTLRQWLSDLSVEIANTDSQDYRESLKLKRSRLQGIAEQLPVRPELRAGA